MKFRQCKCCIENKASGSSDYCYDCWKGIVEPAYRYVEGLKPDDAARMMWHGWAIREAFIAGASAQIKRMKEAMAEK